MMKSDDLFTTIRQFRKKRGDPSQWEEQVWERFGCRRAVLVLDATGFTRITQSHGIVHYLLLVSQVREIVFDVFTRHGCGHCHAAADNIYAHFAAPDDALAAAISANAALHARQIMITESEPFTVCIGIGFGDLLDSGSEGLFGAEMNFASKLGEDIAEGREILLTESAWKNISSKLRDSFEERFWGFSGDPLRYFWMHWHA